MRPANKFTTDGCSGGMSYLWMKIFKKKTPWEGECIKHDMHYWLGGSADDRSLADQILFKNVRDMGHPLFGVCMYLAVRLGGHPSLPFAWHWGFGHDDNDYHRTYYDRHHDDYVLLETECERLKIEYNEIFGVSPRD